MGIGGVRMYINVDFKLTEEIQELIKEETVKATVDYFTKNQEEIRRMVRDSVKGILKSQINEILQMNDYRIFLRDKIAKEIGLED